MSNELQHIGVLGMRWGIRKKQEQGDTLSKQDRKWVKKKSDKITAATRKEVSKELDEYARELSGKANAYNKTGKLSASTVNAYNKKTADLMTKKVSGMSAPSGKVVQFIAKRGEVGVFMALADQGYNMTQLKNGIYDSGKVAYKSKIVDKYNG